MRITGSLSNHTLPIQEDAAPAPSVHFRNASVSSVSQSPSSEEIFQSRPSTPLPLGVSTQTCLGQDRSPENIPQTTERATTEERLKASLQALPLELQQKIFGHALDGKFKLRNAKGVTSLMVASKRMHAAGLGHTEVRDRLHAMQRYTSQLRNSASDPAVQLDLSELRDDEVNYLMKLCLPDKRRSLMPNVVNQSDRQKAASIWSLGGGLKWLHPTQLGTLMATALDIEDPVQQRKAFAGLGKGLVHMGEMEQRVLLHLALTGLDAADEHGMLRSVCSDFSRLRTDQQAAILNHLPALQLDAQINVLVSLSAHLPTLNHDWGVRIVEMLDVPHDNVYQRLRNQEAIRANVLDQVGSLEDAQQVRLISNLSGILDEEMEAIAFGQLASHLGDLKAQASEAAQEAIGRALGTLTDVHLQSHILSGLSASFPLLPLEQPGDFVRLAIEMPNGIGAKGRMLGGLGANLEHVDPGDRVLVFDEALDNTTELDRRLAVNGMAQGAATLESEQIDRLLMAIAGLNDNNKAYAIEGIASNVHVLSEGQCDVLSGLVDTLGPVEKSMALAALSRSLLEEET